MKKKLFFTYLATALFLMACSKDDDAMMEDAPDAESDIQENLVALFVKSNDELDISFKMNTQTDAFVECDTTYLFPNQNAFQNMSGSKDALFLGVAGPDDTNNGQ